MRQESDGPTRPVQCLSCSACPARCPLQAYDALPWPLAPLPSVSRRSPATSSHRAGCPSSTLKTLGLLSFSPKRNGHASALIFATVHVASPALRPLSQPFLGSARGPLPFFIPNAGASGAPSRGVSCALFGNRLLPTSSTTMASNTKPTLEMPSFSSRAFTEASRHY